MTTASFFPKPGDVPAFRAVMGDQSSVGSSPGDALDRMMAKLGKLPPNTIVLLRDNAPDEFFGVEQQSRLQDLMSRWRAAQDQRNPPLTAEEQAELETLIEAETLASARRAAAIADKPGR